MRVQIQALLQTQLDPGFHTNRDMQGINVVHFHVLPPVKQQILYICFLILFLFDWSTKVKGAACSTAGRVDATAETEVLCSGTVFIYMQVSGDFHPVLVLD